MTAAKTLSLVFYILTVVTTIHSGRILEQLKKKQHELTLAGREKTKGML